MVVLDSDVTFSLDVVIVDHNVPTRAAHVDGRKISVVIKYSLGAVRVNDVVVNQGLISARDFKCLVIVALVADRQVVGFQIGHIHNSALITRSGPASRYLHNAAVGDVRPWSKVAA